MTRSAAAVAIGACGWPQTTTTRSSTPVVGYLGTNFANEPANVRRVSDFKEGLREQGFVDGRDITVDFRWPEGGGHPWAREQTTDMMVRGVRVIVVAGTLWRAVRDVNDRTPIVGLAIDGEGLIELGWAESLAHPRGNITGMSHSGRHLSRKMVELLVAALPQLRRLAVMSNLQSSPEKEPQVRAIAQTFGLELLVLDVRGVADVAPAYDRLTAWGAHALMADALTPVSLLAGPVTTLASRHRLPAIYYQKDFVDAGGLMFYAGDRNEEYAQRRCGWYVARILRGTRPGDLPIEFNVTGFRFGVNRRLLADFGLTLSPVVAMQVNEWID